MLNPRKLAAIDVALLGAKIIITEFAGGVFLSAALGGFVLARRHGSPMQFALGIYFIALSLNYIPMLIYAISIKGVTGAQIELGSELDDKRAAMAKYRRQSVWLLVPLVVPIVALMQIQKVNE